MYNASVGQMYTATTGLFVSVVATSDSPALTFSAGFIEVEGGVPYDKPAQQAATKATPE